MADSSDAIRARRRHSRRVLTAGAAASLVLTVAPALPASTVPAPSVDSPSAIRPSAIRSSRTPVRSVAAASRYRTSMRRARAILVAAQSVANNLFRAKAVPVRQHFEARRDMATSRYERRGAEAAYSSAMLPLTIARNSAMAEAKATYVANVERARVQFLSDSGASSGAWAGARYQQSLHVATAEYRLAVGAARDVYRLAVSPLRAEVVREENDSAVSDTEGTRHRFRRASADAAGVLQLQIRQARDAYLAQVAIAKNHLQAVPV